MRRRECLHVVQTIDIHTHAVPRDFPSYTGSCCDVPWPSMVHDHCGHAEIMIGGKLFRKIGEAAWSAPRRVADMVEMGIARQVVSPMPELLSYWLDVADAVMLLRHVNAEIAAMVAQASGAVIGMGAVPLQDVDRAIRELRYNAESLGLRAVEVGSNVNGVAIGDTRFEPFFAAAADMGIAVFVHALRATGKERLVGPPMLEQIVAFPGEIALAAASLVTGGVLARHPSLRIAFSHGGGGFALTLARMQHFWQHLPRFGDLLIEAPIETARRAFYDLTVFDPLMVRMLADSVGPGQLLLGSDYPFAAYEARPLDLLARAGLAPDVIAMIGRDNALRYLGLASEAGGAV